MDWLMQASIEKFSLLAYGITFLAGLISSTGPCNLTAIPLIIGYVGGYSLSRARSFAISFVFTLGLAITFVGLGAVAALIGGLFGQVGTIWYWVIAGICILIGLSLLGVYELPLPGWLVERQTALQQRGLAGALVLGLASGLVTSQCATPVLVAILTLVMARGAVIYGATLLFIYALGRGVPIVAAGTFAGVLKGLLGLGRWTTHVERVSGAVIVAAGLYFLWIA
jgi:cytochrome c-type biogenesis protein